MRRGWPRSSPSASVARLPRISRPSETGLFLALVFSCAWPLLQRALDDDANADRFSTLAMCVPGLLGLVFSLLCHREGPDGARIGVGRWPAWTVAFVAPIVVILAIAVGADHFGALGTSADFRLSLPWVGDARGVGTLGKLTLFLLVLDASYVVAAVVEDLARRLPRQARTAIRTLTWSVAAFVTHGAGDFGEELGWRGYLLRRWEDRPRAGVLLSSCGWAFFHLPWALRLARTNGPVTACLFLVSIALLGVPMAALYRWGRSTWPCAVAHGMLDAWDGMLLGSPLFPSPGYGRVASGWANPMGVCVFAVVAVVTWVPACRARGGTSVARSIASDVGS